jgi:ElaB/YqjD/DUF883 family membrane-anchored ribosome-binding protein
MENESEVIRQQMADTRNSLSEKLETLEQHVVGTVQGATETVANVADTVQETVENVKESVQGTVETVKETFDLQRQVNERPWLIFGGSIALGFLGGYLLLGGRRERSHSHSWEGRQQPPDWSAVSSGGNTTEHTSGSEESSSWTSAIADNFGSEIAKLKGMAVGAVIGTVRDMVTQSAPSELGTSLREVFDGITTKLGGEPIQGSAKEDAQTSEQSPAESKRGDSRDRSDATEMGRKMATAHR